MTPEISVDPTAHRVARHVRDVDLTEYQSVIRGLFASPFVRPGDASRLGLLRKWESSVREDLESIGRYRLDVTTTSARLAGRSVVLDSTRPARTANDARRPFDARRYAYLCLVTAGLLSAGSQVLLSDLDAEPSWDVAE